MLNSDFILINCLDEWISVDPSTIKIYINFDTAY